MQLDIQQSLKLLEKKIEACVSRGEAEDPDCPSGYQFNLDTLMLMGLRPDP